MKGKLGSMVVVVFLLCALAIGGCSMPGNGDSPDFSGVKSIADLATLRCFYHNVVEIKNDGTDILLGAIKVGYKKAWYEYSGSVELGINMKDVHISAPNGEGVVTVEIPEVKVFDTQVDEETIDEICVDKGLFQSITNEEKVEALDRAQKDIKKEAANDALLRRQAVEQAEVIIESYIVNVGKSVGEDYRVEFRGKDVE